MVMGLETGNDVKDEHMRRASVSVFRTLAASLQFPFNFPLRARCQDVAA